MVLAFLRFARLFVTIPMFELAGAALIIAGVWLLAGFGWALIAAGVLALLKSLDLALEKGESQKGA